MTESGDALNPEGLRPVLGVDDRDQRWIWLDQATSAPLAGTRQMVDSLRAIPVPLSLQAAAALRLAALLPAWRLVRASEVKLGSSVLITDPAWPAREVLTLSRLAGARWRALGGGHPESDAEFVVPFADPADTAKAMPERPDAVIVLSGNGPAIDTACRVCRDLGVVVVAPAPLTAFDLDLYPDIHRRGLRVKLISHGYASSKGWESLRAIDEVLRSNAPPKGGLPA